MGAEMLSLVGEIFADATYILDFGAVTVMPETPLVRVIATSESTEMGETVLIHPARRMSSTGVGTGVSLMMGWTNAEAVPVGKFG